MPFPSRLRNPQRFRSRCLLGRVICNSCGGIDLLETSFSGELCNSHGTGCTTCFGIECLTEILKLSFLKRAFFPETIFLTVDDTLVRKRGLNMFGAGMRYDSIISNGLVIFWYVTSGHKQKIDEEYPWYKKRSMNRSLTC